MSSDLENQPGINFTEVKSKIIGPKEFKAIKKLSKVWYIAKASKKEYQGRKYKFAILKPTQKLIDSFHLERDILAIFVDETRFPESDFLVFSEWMVSNFLKDKVDKLCVMVICEDKDIVDKVKSLVSRNSESKIIVPFTFNECADEVVGDEFFLIDRLKNFFYERNLFDHRSPLCNDTYFFGRNEILQSLYDRYKSGENSGLFGIRKIGKTSVSYALQRRLQLRDEPVLFIDLESLHKKRWFNLLRQIILRLAREYNLDSQRFEAYTSNQYIEEDAQELFERDIKAIFTSLDRKRILLIFDEVEHITFETSSSQHWREENDFLDFWQAIRASFQNNREIFSFMITGTNPKAVETTFVPGGYENPIKLLVPSQYLGGFDELYVKEMVSYIGNYMGLHFEEKVFEKLTDDHQGNPFLIRQACSVIHHTASSERPVTIDLEYYNKHKEKINSGLYEAVDMILETLQKRYEEEYELLKYLANGEYSVFKYYIELSQRYVQHIKNYGLIEEKYGKYQFSIPVIGERLREISCSNSVAPYEPDSNLNFLLSAGEGLQLEFKSTLCWDIDNNRKNRDLENEVVKTVCAFMNTKGGTLLIGVSDNQKSIGLNFDYKALKINNTDAYSRHLSNNVLANRLDADLVCLYEITFPKIHRKSICRVDVKPSPRPVFVKYRKEKSRPFEEYFFIRNDASSRALQKSELVNYCARQWPNNT